MAQSINELIQDKMFKFAIKLEQFNQPTQRQIQAMLDTLVDDLRKQLEAAAPGDQIPSRKRRRMEALIKQARATIRRQYGAIWPVHQQSLDKLAAVTERGTTQVFNEAFTFEVAEPTLTPQELQALSRDPIVLGQHAQEWWEGQSQARQQAYASQMRVGIAAGETNDELVNRIIGKPTGKRVAARNEDGSIKRRRNGKAVMISEREGGVMDMGKREATALVRTSAQTVSNDTMMRTYAENQAILKGVAALVTLDGRTTKICMGRSGAIWDPRTGDPLPESTRQEGFPGPPPWHWQCRTVLTPVTKSWDELRAEAAAKSVADKDGVKRKRPPLSKERRDKLDTVPKVKRQSMDGEVPGGHTYESWLRSKDESFQKAQLGKARFDLWKDGKITIAQLTDFSGRDLTVAELRELAGEDK